ncbi:glycosyltransferase family 2 protein [Ferroacidibacillus organovorans]|uniref:Glycosyltransferase 2-like domain-containing protein n=1 Tax=Ferroacidibacillus organovorans TaxID=1765683 RepID=A0A101XRP3_9BACL|nr:glycosyltransferase family 2 protein [Ferroacidibacillus organovorans]KUO96285.1 hypothetical protein ATW55_03485 [Ferroacidibacillus organovorans]
MNSIVDIVIVNYNTKKLLLTCLESIHKHTDEPHHIYIVDNGSTDGSVERLARIDCSHLNVIANSRNTGYAVACNQGIRAGQSPFILLLNSDVIVTQGWLSPLLECMNTDSKIAVVGPKMVNQKGLITGAGIVGTYQNHAPRGFMEVDAPGKYEEVEDCFSVCGAAYLIRRSLLDTLGLFDENYFFYFEETDYSLNARSKGYRVVYCPKSKIIHLTGQSNKNHEQLRNYFTVSEHYFRKKWSHLGTTEF